MFFHFYDPTENPPYKISYIRNFKWFCKRNIWWYSTYPYRNHGAPPKPLIFWNILTIGLIIHYSRLGWIKNSRDWMWEVMWIVEVRESIGTVKTLKIFLKISILVMIILSDTMTSHKRYYSSAWLTKWWLWRIKKK